MKNKITLFLINWVLFFSCIVIIDFLLKQHNNLSFELLVAFFMSLIVVIRESFLSKRDK